MGLSGRAGVRTCRGQMVAPWRWEGCRPAAAKTVVFFFVAGAGLAYTHRYIARAVSVVRAGRCRSTQVGRRPLDVGALVPLGPPPRWTDMEWYPISTMYYYVVCNGSRLPLRKEERRRGSEFPMLTLGLTSACCPAHPHAVFRNSEPNSGNTQHSTAVGRRRARY